MPTRAGRVLPVAGLAAAAAGLVAVGAVTWRGLGRPAASADVTPAEARAAAWRAAGLTPQGTAEAHVASGREALAADLPERDAEALRHFMEALALEPSRLEAVAGWLTAFAASAGEDPDGDELREAHRLATWALARAPDRPDLLAGWARILLAAPGARNASEALAAAAKAVERGGGADALLALAQARLGSDPRGSADAAERALAAAPEDRRPLLAGARALWRAGEARAALERVERRLAIDRGHGGALALEGAILAAAGRVDAARAVLRRWVAAAPRSAEPLLAAGMLAAQVDGDLPEARRLLARARALPASDFLAARVLAQAAAVERTAGDAAAARRHVEQALARVPASGPARFQEALLAFARGDAAAHRRAQGVLAGREGPLLARVLGARTAELAGQVEEASAAWEGIASAEPHDLALQLQAAGAQARLRAPGRALPILRRAATLDPAAPRARRALGDYWEGPAALAAAARELAAMAAEEPAAAEALAGAAACELLLGRAAAAEELARRATALAPHLARAHVVLAQAALDRGRPGEASRQASAALEAEPGGAVALEVWARALEAAGRPADAARTRRRALAANPKLASARLGEARRLLREGQREAASSALRLLVADEPEDALARGALLEAESGRR